MSGPKGSSYSVLENRRREEARRRALLDDLGRARDELHAAQLAAEIHARAGADVSPETLHVAVDESDNTSIKSAIRAVRQHTDEVRRESAAALAALQRTRTLDGLTAGVGQSEVRTAAEAMEGRTGQTTRSSLGDTDRRRVEAALGQLDPEQSGAQDELLALSARLVDAAPDTRRSIIEELERRVRRLNHEAERRREEMAAARELELDLMGVAGDAADELRLRLGAVVSGDEPFDTRLAEQVAEVVAARRMVEDRLHVAVSLRESLEALGYTVGDDFVTSLGGEAVGYVERPGWSQHLLEVRLPSTSDRIVMAAVRQADTASTGSESARTRDTEVEVEFCATFDPLIEQLAEHGIRMDQIVRNPPGVNPMNVVQPDGHKRKTRARDSTPLRSMESP